MKKPHNIGKPWSELTKIKISVGKQHKFDFVKNQKLKDILERDFSYAELCRKEKMYKPAIIFYGSIIEAVLQYLLNSGGKFYKLIEEAKQKKVVRQEIASRLEVIKYFRNYIHIKAELNGDIEVSVNEANFFYKVCDKLLESFKNIDS